MALSLMMQVEAPGAEWASLGRPGQEAVLEGVPDVLVDAVADAVELGHVRRHCRMPTHLHSAGVSPSPQWATSPATATYEDWRYASILRHGDLGCSARCERK